MASRGELLWAATRGGRLLVSEATAPDSDWTDVRDAIAVVGLAVVQPSGHLLVACSDSQLWAWHPSSRPSVPWAAAGRAPATFLAEHGFAAAAGGKVFAAGPDDIVSAMAEEDGTPAEVEASIPGSMLASRLQLRAWVTTLQLPPLAPASVSARSKGKQPKQWKRKGVQATAGSAKRPSLAQQTKALERLLKKIPTTSAATGGYACRFTHLGCTAIMNNKASEASHAFESCGFKARATSHPAEAVPATNSSEAAGVVHPPDN